MVKRISFLVGEHVRLSDRTLLELPTPFLEKWGGCFLGPLIVVSTIGDRIKARSTLDPSKGWLCTPNCLCAIE